jgi:proteasome activator subunit 4
MASPLLSLERNLITNDSSSWLLMRYPIPKSTRSKLVRLYYELCNMPGIEIRVIRSWADKLTRLLINKSSSKLWLEASDLQLPWQPLWHTMQKYLWRSKKDRQEASV